MGRAAVVDLFCEDAGHEGIARALLARVSRESGKRRPDVRARSTRGGLGKTITELRLWQRTIPSAGPPGDLLLVMLDGNSEGPAERRRQVLEAIDPALFPYVVVGCPDPHVEAWCCLDPQAWKAVTGRAPPSPPKKATKDAYKQWLGEALEAADIPVLNDPMDIARDLVPHLDLFAAGKADASFHQFESQIRAFFARWSPA